jgi:4-hydroxyphenylpyruvate dioxygenase-like putative hemolysin
MRLAIAQVGALQVELIQPLEGPSIYKEFLAERGEGLHHLQSRVNDIAKPLAAFSEQGIGVLMSGKFGEGEFYYLDTERLFGFTYEVVKRRTRPAPEATYPPDSASTFPR